MHHSRPRRGRKITRFARMLNMPAVAGCRSPPFRRSAIRVNSRQHMFDETGIIMASSVTVQMTPGLEQKNSDRTVYISIFTVFPAGAVQ